MFMSVNSISDNWYDNLQSLNQEKNEASVPVFYADWTSVPVTQTSSLRGLDVGFILPLPKKLPYMANNDEYNDEYLCRDFFVGFIFWPKLSFQISGFRVHWFMYVRPNHMISGTLYSYVVHVSNWQGPLLV